ncbi:aminopeptidase P family protein [Loktanella sp. S4079]|uniref:aminopeptidase P family protein n=1 Tax=Loktanella sp. S4079 TaxID=579483 RepID=UPI0005F9C433|nr:aminopeptidase P family protein [Loktanella sp. S4079]KJZ20510.1 X-Pro aminopeptidase [Loktanella sp. S4079]
MFQSFAAQSNPEQGPPRLAALRKEMQSDSVDAFLVPRADAHQGEYVAPRDARLSWLTGFSGSAGFCAVLPQIAGVFIDGRYRVQVRSEVADVFTPVHWPETQLADWLLEHLAVGSTVAYDPWLHTVREIATLKKKLKDYTLQPTDNLVDAIWHDQPAPPAAPFTVQPIAYAGETHAEKRARIAKTLKADAAVITLPDSIAWLLNIRGTDIERNPVPQCFAILHASGQVKLYAERAKLTQVSEHLGDEITTHDVADFLKHLSQHNSTVQIDETSCPQVVADALLESEITPQHCADPCLLPKAIKNQVEIDGAKEAHLRDGVAMVRFLHWLDETAPQGNLTEIDVVKKLEAFRIETNALRDISFETICGAGPHGAIVHYRVNENTNRPVARDELLLVDSGGQYQDGTTDITRTVVVGEPTPTQRACFTRVLQGMVAISRIRFPRGLSGQHLDALARAPLWMAGQDYDHGTGHGVGSYLSVHEGPQSLSRRSDISLEPGMILSNEPGYYREGVFGIRIENLITVIEAPAIAGADDRDMLAFDTLTFVPLDRRLIEIGMLSTEERDWIDRYHADTVALLAPRLDDATRAWLTQACAPL